MKKTLAVILIALILTALIFDAASMTRAVIKTIETCLYTIIPALFGFIAVASYLIKSGLYKIIFKPFYIALRYFIKLDEEEFGIFLLSLFGGYPIGVKLITDNEASGGSLSKILPFCYCPSPGFVISVVGIGIFGNMQAGLIVYFSNVLACVILSVILSFRNKKSSPKMKEHQPLRLTQEIFTSSVTSAAAALFPVCVVVVVFGIFAQTFRFFGIEGLIGEYSVYFFAFLEISNASAIAANVSALPLLAALFSFGGFCIIMQIPALSKGRIPLKSFFLWRIPAAVLSALLCKILIPLFNFNNYIPVTVNIRSSITPHAHNPIASAALLIMAVILVKTAQEKVI